MTTDDAAWIGLCGPISAGKTTAAGHLQAEYGHRYIRYSQVLERMLVSQGLQPSRSELQRIGIEVFNSMGGAGLTKLLLAEVGETEKLVVDGIRHRSDVRALRDHRAEQGFLLVFLDAPEDVRRIRYDDRDTDEVPFDDACNHQVESEVATLRVMADFVLENHGTVDEMFDTFDLYMAGVRG